MRTTSLETSLELDKAGFFELFPGAGKWVWIDDKVEVRVVTLSDMVFALGLDQPFPGDMSESKDSWEDIYEQVKFCIREEGLTVESMSKIWLRWNARNK